MKDINQSNEIANSAINGRQREILMLAAMGLTDKQISVKLDISTWTIRSYWDRLRLRLNSASRTQAVATFAARELAGLEGQLNSLIHLVALLDGWSALAIEDRFLFVGDEFSKALGSVSSELVGRDPRDFLGEDSGRYRLGDPRLGVETEVRDGVEMMHLVTSKPVSSIQDERASIKAIEPLSELAWIARPDGFIEYCNPWWTQFTGFEVEFFRGVGCARIIHPDEITHSRDRWRAAQAGSSGYSGVCLYRQGSGSYVQHLLTMEPIKGSDGQVKFWTGRAHSIEI